MISISPKIILRWVAAAAALYALYCVLLFAAQRKMIYPGTMIPLPEASPPAGTETFTLSSGEDRVEAWYLPAKGGATPRGAVIYAHGNYELIRHHGDDLLPYRDMGLSVLMLEYPGYGSSPGSPTQEGIVALHARGYDWLVQQKGIPGGAVILHGRSLGGGVACALSLRRHAAGLVLESTFTSVADLGRKYYVPSFLILDRYDNYSAVKAFHGPILIIHGTADRVIPFSHGLALKDAGKNVIFLSRPFGHNDMPHDGLFWSNVRLLVERAIP